MDRAQFMKQLERLLSDISEAEKQEALAYYNSYFDEAGPENEASVIRELGSPGKVAAIIKADLDESNEEYAQYTENGYEDIYVAAALDGASAFKKIRYITLPMLKPTVVLLILFGLGGILKGSFDLFYNLIGTNSLLYAQTDIIDTYVFRSLMVNYNFSQGAAVGLYQSLFGLVLVLAVNAIVKKVEPDYALF